MVTRKRTTLEGMHGSAENNPSDDVNEAFSLYYEKINEFDPRACQTNLIRLRGNAHRISRRADQVTSSAPPQKSSFDGALLDCECNWQHASDLRR